MKCKICGGTGTSNTCVNGTFKPCSFCDGTGEVVHPMMSMNGDEYTGEWEQHECEACHGTGEVEMTEQEYIQTCNHKELTEILFRIIVHGSVIRPDRQYISEWLKQPHTIKE